MLLAGCPPGPLLCGVFALSSARWSGLGHYLVRRGLEIIKVDEKQDRFGAIVTFPCDT